jgi:hypothetical protein
MPPRRGWGIFGCAGNKHFAPDGAEQSRRHPVRKSSGAMAGGTTSHQHRAAGGSLSVGRSKHWLYFFSSL